MKTGDNTSFLAAILLVLQLFAFSSASAYEVAVGLGSTASPDATIAMGDRSQWPMVADLSWGPLANLVPIGQLPRSQQQAVFGNFRQRRAIAEIPFPAIYWNSPQPDIALIESFGLSVQYVFVLYEYAERVTYQGRATADALQQEGVIDSMLTRDEILRLKTRFPNKKIIMNTRSWTRDNGHLQNVQDVVDGVCIEFMPHNTAAYIAKDVAPFCVWAHEHNKILLLLMPPLPDDYLEDRYVKAVTQAARAIYDANVTRLPHGWMKNNNFIFVPANYTWETSGLSYVPEDARNTILAAAKSLLLMRPELDAGPVAPASASHLPAIMSLLLGNKQQQN